MSEPLLKYREPVAAQDVLTEAVPARSYTEGSGLNLARAALFGVPLPRVGDIVDLLKSYRGGRPNSLIGGGPLGWSWYSTLADMATDHHGNMDGFGGTHHAHSQLSGVGIDDHHARDHATRHHSGGADALALGSIAGNLTDAQHGSRTVANAHAHSHLSGVGVNDHHARDHVLATNTGLGATHTISGAAAGQVLRASSASAAKFQQLAHADLGGVTANQHHAAFTSADHAAIGDGAPHHAENHASRHLVGGADALSVGTPVAIGASNAAGSATNFARRDHVHAHGTTIRCSGRFGMARMPDGTSGKVLTAQGVGADPAYATGKSIVTGSYTGNGSDTARQITTGMKCSLVVIIRASDLTYSACFIIPNICEGSRMDATAHYRLSDYVYLHATDGFVVADGGNLAMNVNLETYYYWAISE